MATEQSSTRNEKDVVVLLTLLFCSSVLFISLCLFVLNVQPFLFLLLLSMGSVVGLVFARRRCPTWSRVLRPTGAYQHPYRYTGFYFLFGLAFTIVLARLAEPMKRIFVSAVLGPLSGFLVGYFFWLIALFLRRNKTRSA